MLVEQGSEGSKYLAEYQLAVDGLGAVNATVAAVRARISESLSIDAIGPIRIIEMGDEDDPSRMLLIQHRGRGEGENASGSQEDYCTYVYRDESGERATITIQGLEGFKQMAATWWDVKIPFIAQSDGSSRPYLVEVDLDNRYLECKNPFGQGEYALTEYRGRFEWGDGGGLIHVRVKELDELKTHPDPLVKLSSKGQNQNPYIRYVVLASFNREIEYTEESSWARTVEEVYELLDVNQDNNHQ